VLSLMFVFAVQSAVAWEGPSAPPTPALGTLEPDAAGDGWAAPVQVTGAIDGVTTTHALIMYLPKGYNATKATVKRPLILALHGWNHSAQMFRDKGYLGKWADQYGIVLAVPDMGKTVYETAFYKETKAAKAWSTVPGTRWVAEVILPYVRTHYAVATDRAHTAAIGYSTGGRGAVLIAEAYPELAFAGSTSGTYDLMKLLPKEGEYRIHGVVYGEREAFPKRWEHDNIIAPERLAGLRGVRLYISHGTQDRSVNPNQVDALRDALRASDVVATYDLVKGAKHEWAFWTTQWGPMFAAAADVFTAATPR